MAYVYPLWHSYEDEDECEQVFLLGIYSSREEPHRRLERARRLPGFRRYPDGFVVDEYEVDADQWTSGFVTMTPEGEWVDDPEP